MPRHLLFGRRFARHLWHLTRIYWGSADARKGAPLLAGAIALELGAVYGNLRLSDAERRLMDALQVKEPTAFVNAVALFSILSVLVVLAAAYRIYLRQLVEMRWRRGVTADYVERWISQRAYGLAQLHRDEIDNPDQRIAEDIREFAASALGLALSLLAAVTTLITFGDLLWTVSAHWVFPVRDIRVHIPGFLLWVALLYAAASTCLTHMVGRPLVGLNVERLRYEADFRHQLIRFRDNIEPVLLSNGDAHERVGALDRFTNVVLNWWRLVAAQRRLSVFTGVIGQANGLVPLLVAAPGFFAGLITLGVVVQIRFAYGQVSGALNWFVYAYQEIARWRANVERLTTFSEVIETTARDLARGDIHVVSGELPILRVTDLRLDTRAGQPLLDVPSVTVNPGERVAIVGPSGAGKTTLLRAIAGLWPFGSGRIELPAGRRVLFLSQWPYLPSGSLRAAVAYPEAQTEVSDEEIRTIFGLLGVDGLASRLDEAAAWDQELSPDEQQRVAMARVLVHAPEWLFLDNAMSALDRDMGGRVYGLIETRLPHAAVIAIVDRASVGAFYQRRWALCPRESGRFSLEAT